MPSLNSIAPEKLARLIGISDSPVVIDVRGHHPQLPPGVPEFRRAHAQSAIVVVVSKLDPQFMLHAMRAGLQPQRCALH